MKVDDQLIIFKIRVIPLQLPLTVFPLDVVQASHHYDLVGPVLVRAVRRCDHPALVQHGGPAYVVGEPVVAPLQGHLPGKFVCTGKQKMLLIFRLFYNISQ